MTYNTGKLFFILIVAVLLSCIAAWGIAYRYRRVMQYWMRAPVTGLAVDTPLPVTSKTQAPPVPVSLAENRQAGLRLTLLLIGLSLLMAISSAVIWMVLAFPGEALPPKRVAAVALLYSWPVIPALGLMWRWSRKRLFGVLALWCLACFLVLLWRSIEPRPLELLAGMASEIGFTLLLAGLILLGNATRAIAPWLLLPFIGLVWASIAGIDGLDLLVQRRSSFLAWLPAGLDARLVMLLFAVLPWLLAWWPLRQLGRALGYAYTRKWLSDLLMVFTTLWAFALIDKALMAANGAGMSAVTMLLPLLWIPLVMLSYARFQQRQGRPPTLLVLRVFQRDQAVQALFDHVIERWRLSGNTVMIAGTDLADRTLDADDIFTFLDGRLAQRFIRAPAEVAPRIAAFDWAPDADGRYRVNECYCHDTTWQAALQALVELSDVVLMDLRGFQAHNAGCSFELATLAQTSRALRVVVLVDGQTDRAAAAAAIAPGNPQRFVWLDVSGADAPGRRAVLAALFDKAQATAPSA